MREIAEFYFFLLRTSLPSLSKLIPKKWRKNYPQNNQKKKKQNTTCQDLEIPEPLLYTTKNRTIEAIWLLMAVVLVTICVLPALHVQITPFDPQ